MKMEANFSEPIAVVAPTDAALSTPRCPIHMGGIATGSGDRSARLWPAPGGTAETLRGPHDAAVTAVTFFHGGQGR